MMLLVLKEMMAMMVEIRMAGGRGPRDRTLDLQPTAGQEEFLLEEGIRHLARTKGLCWVLGLLYFCGLMRPAAFSVL